MFEKLKSLLPGRATPTPSSDSVGHWPFDQPRNCAAITMKQVLDKSEQILLVSHDADDHGWQFIGSTNASTADGRVVCLDEMVKLDPTILEVANLPPGWEAVRKGNNYPWTRCRSTEASSNDDKTAPARSAPAFICSVCHKEHKGLPDIGADKPDDYWDVPEERRKQDIKLTGDTCEIAGKFFFVRGVIEIPVSGWPECFGFGVWVSHKEENYRKYLEHFDSAEIGPFFGWLCTRIKYYSEDTSSLKTMVHYRGGGLRPVIKVELGTHPLSLDQQNGISLEKAWEIVHFYTEDNTAS